MSKALIYFNFIILQIIIEGIKGAGNRIDIAIDDISFQDVLCRCKY